MNTATTRRRSTSTQVGLPLNDDTPVDDVLRGWIVRERDRVLRVYGRSRTGAWIAAVADQAGRDLRPVRLVNLGLHFGQLDKWAAIARKA